MWGSLLLLSQLSSRHPTIEWGIHFGGLAGSHPIPLPSLHGGEGSFSGLIPTDDTVDTELVIGIQPGDSDVVIGYQIEEFTHTWSTEWCVACSHIYNR